MLHIHWSVTLISLGTYMKWVLFVWLIWMYCDITATARSVSCMQIAYPTTCPVVVVLTVSWIILVRSVMDDCIWDSVSGFVPSSAHWHPLMPPNPIHSEAPPSSQINPISWAYVISWFQNYVTIGWSFPPIKPLLLVISDMGNFSWAAV